jgi:hypothetical protein
MYARVEHFAYQTMVGLADFFGVLGLSVAEHDSRRWLVGALRHHPPAQTRSTAEEIDAR